jgi:hypothetical protein
MPISCCNHIFNKISASQVNIWCIKWRYLTLSDLINRIKYSKFVYFWSAMKICGWKALTMAVIRRRQHLFAILNV